MSVRTFNDRFTVGVLITLVTFFARTAIAQSGQGYGSRPVVAGYGMGG